MFVAKIGNAVKDILREGRFDRRHDEINLFNAVLLLVGVFVGVGVDKIPLPVDFYHVALLDQFIVRKADRTTARLKFYRQHTLAR